MVVRRAPANKHAVPMARTAPVYESGEMAYRDRCCEVCGGPRRDDEQMCSWCRTVFARVAAAESVLDAWSAALLTAPDPELTFASRLLAARAAIG